MQDRPRAERAPVGRRVGRFVPVCAILVLGAALTLALGLPGCSVAAQARAATDFRTAVPGERTPTAREVGLPEEGEVGLDQLVRTAVRIQPAVVRARRNAEAARARCCEAEADRLPQVTASASGSYRDQSSRSGSSAHRFGAYGFDVSWLLFDFGRTNALVRNAGEAWLAAQEDEQQAEVDTAFAVRSAYYELSKQIQLERVAEETVKQYEARLEQVQGFVEAGTRIPYDETKAKVDLLNAQVAEVETHDALRLAQANLASAVGLAESLAWTTRVGDDGLAVPDTMDTAWTSAREHQPSLAAVAARERAASAIVDAQVARLYPSVSVGFGYGASGSDLPFPWDWSVGPRVSWTPFDGFANVCSVEEAVATLRAARASRAQTEQGAWRDLRAAWLGIEDARQRVELTRSAVVSARDTLDLAQERFQVGKATSVELADALQSLAAARGAAVQAVADLAAARAAVARSMGVVERPGAPSGAGAP